MSDRRLAVAVVFLVLGLGAMACRCSRKKASTPTPTPTPTATQTPPDIRGSGEHGDEQRVLDGFSKMRVAGSIDVSFRPGSPHGARVLGDDNLVGRVLTRVDDDTLYIDTRGRLAATERLIVRVQAPQLVRLEVAGEGIVRAKLDGEHFRVELTGDGDAILSGRTQTLDVELSGDGDVDALDLAADEATVVLSGSGDVRVNAKSALSVEITGSGDVDYRGNPTVSKQLHGTGGVFRL